MASATHDYQVAFLLLQVLGAEHGQLQKGNANKALLKGGNQRLGLGNAKNANALRESLCPRYIKKSRGKTDKGGTTDFYELTDDGKARLLEVSQYPLEIQIPGRSLDRLRQIAQAASGHDGKTGPRRALPADFPQEILRIVEDLRAERFGHTGLVPIHELRTLIRKQHGEDAARHSELDEAVMDLWRAGKLRLVPINDGRSVTPDQLNDSIPGSHETWFYLELVG
jgi:hypothetical protein